MSVAAVQVTLIEGAVMLDTQTASLASWLSGPRFAEVSSIVQLASVRSLPAEAAIREDATLQSRCSEAFAAVCGPRSDPICPLVCFVTCDMLQWCKGTRCTGQ